MAVSPQTKRIIIHIARGLSYVTFPAGVFLFALFIFSAYVHNLDFTAAGTIPLTILAFLLFPIPPIVILFLHPASKPQIQNVDKTIMSSFDRYLPHIAIIVILAVIVLIPFFFLLTFIFATAGFG